MCLVRRTHRTQTQQARRGHGLGELRDREGQCRGGRRGFARDADRGRRDRGLHRAPARADAAGNRWHRTGSRGPGHRCAAHPSAGVGRAHGAGDRDGDGARVAVHLLAVAVADAGRAGRGVGCVAVPPRGVAQPASRHRDHGHPDFDGHAGRVRLVVVRAVLGHRRCSRDDASVLTRGFAHRRCGQHLPRGRRRGDDVHPGRTLLRGQVETTRLGRPARADGTRCEGCRGTEERCRTTHPDRPAGRRRRVRGAAGGEDRHRRCGGRRVLGGRRIDAHG